MTLLVVAVLVFVVYRATTEAERAAFASDLRVRLQQGAAAADRWYSDHEPFFDALRARTPFAPVTPALVLVNVVVFVVVLVTGFFQGGDALVAWGASIGPRTTNGEWWRLVTSLFVHAGPLHLLACLIGFFPISFLLERLVGSVAVVIVYVTCGACAGLVSMFTDPMTVSTGASGAVFGLYGLGLVTVLRGLVQKPRLTVPWGVMKWVILPGLAFAAYNIPSGRITIGAELSGFAVGVLCGVAIAKGVAVRPIPVRRTATMAALACGLMLAAAVPLRGMTDVRPDVDRMIATDERTAATFRAAATKVALGRTTERAMAAVIEGEIIPALEREQPYFVATRVVPDDQRQVMKLADDYLVLRIESWRLRARALRKGSLAMLRQADIKEGAARDLLGRIPYPLSPR